MGPVRLSPIFRGGWRTLVALNVPMPVGYTDRGLARSSNSWGRKLTTFEAGRAGVIYRPGMSDLTGFDARSFENLSLCKMKLAVAQRLTRPGSNPIPWTATWTA